MKRDDGCHTLKCLTTTCYERLVYFTVNFKPLVTEWMILIPIPSIDRETLDRPDLAHRERTYEAECVPVDCWSLLLWVVHPPGLALKEWVLKDSTQCALTLLDISERVSPVREFLYEYTSIDLISFKSIIIQWLTYNVAR